VVLKHESNIGDQKNSKYSREIRRHLQELSFALDAFHAKRIPNMVSVEHDEEFY
jgi:hypothetical protein